MKKMKVTMLLIDDHPMLRAGIKQLINTTQHFNIIAEAGDGKTGIKLARELEPDLILLDISIGDMNGLDVLHQLKHIDPITSKIIMFTVSDDQENILYALQHGADGYLLKDMDPNAFLTSLINIVNNNVILEKSVIQSLLAQLEHKKSTQTTEADLMALTQREQETFRLLIQGLTNKTIANKLAITESTVKVHVKNIFKKLNVKSRVEIMIKYLHHNKTHQ